MPNDPTTQTKKSLHSSEIISRLYLIEREQKESDSTIKKWADSLLLNEHLKLIKKLSKGAFDISFKAKQTAIYFYCINKILLKIDPVLVVSQLLSLEDIQVKLITYLRDTQKEIICTDSIFIFESIISNGNGNECKKLITQDFIMSLFDLLDIIEDELNFKAAVQVLIEINFMFSSLNNNIFLKVNHVHPNARVFNEILFRLINEEDNQDKMIKMFLCLRNILDNVKDNILYSTDLESFIDIIIIKLQIAESELTPFIIDIIEKITIYPEYYRTMYKIDEILNLFADFACNNDTVEELVKLKSKQIFETLSQTKKEKL